MKYRLSIILVFAILTLCACTNKPDSHKSTRLLMGTYVEVTAIDPNGRATEIANKVLDELSRIESLTSFHKTSDLVSLNAEAGKGPIAVNPELYTIISGAIDIAKITNGAYDPTIGVISKLWNFSGSTETRVPSQQEIDIALNKVGYRKIVLHDGNRIELLEPGMEIDLGGFTKGYALNSVNNLLEKLQAQSVLVNIGGDILARGFKSPGKPWKIGIEHPRDKTNLLATIQASDQLVFTSGDYERFIEVDGKRYHHILDPKTGYPSDKMRSTTLVGVPGAIIQPLGAAIFVIGVEQGLKILDQLDKVQGLIVDNAGSLHFSRGAQDCFLLQ